MLERELVSAKEPEAGFTAKSCALLGQYDRATCSWKTSQQSFLCSEPSLVTWPRWGMTADGCAYEHRQSVRQLIGIGGGVLPAPTRAWAKRGPGVSFQSKGRYSEAKVRLTLQIVKAIGWKWPARLLERMMLWPIDYTALQHSATAKSRSKPQSRGDCSEGLE